MSKIHLGIMVRYVSSHPPFTEKYFFRVISLYGQKLGIDVTVFSPKTVLWDQHQVIGYRYNPKINQWIKGNYPIPNVLYDRIQYSNRKQHTQYHYLISRLQQEQNCVLLGRGLPGKWNVYKMIKDIPEIKSYLPETVCYSHDINLKEKLIQKKAVFFKPASGSNGRGVFRLSFDHSGLSILGRNAKNKLFTKHFKSFRSVNAWIHSFVGTRQYVIQPYLELSTVDGHPFDIRILLQKNHLGEWTETGRAARVGKKLSLTSNLDGGGTAIEVDPFLRKYYSTEVVKQINEAVSTILATLPYRLEKHHGQLVELGIDIGVDRNGNVWVLEVNSKPGRHSFRLAQNNRAFLSSLITPVKYASYVLSKSGGR